MKKYHKAIIIGLLMIFWICLGIAIFGLSTGATIGICTGWLSYLFITLGEKKKK